MLSWPAATARRRVTVGSQVMALARFKDLCMDATDPARLGEFWAEVLDIDSVPEPKTAKNRVHWDVTVPAVQPLIDAGATVLAPPNEHARWHVLADPEGNEFCAFTE